MLASSRPLQPSEQPPPSEGFGRKRIDSNARINHNNDHEEKEGEVIAFLRLLEKDLDANSHHVRPVPPDLLERARDLVTDVEVDLGTPLEWDNE